MDQPRGSTRDRGAAAWRVGLRDAIAARVVPRLSDGAGAGRGACPDGIARFAALALAGPAEHLVREAEALLAGGLAAEPLMLDLVGPAARRLGDMWLDDRIGFIDVTAGLGRLQALVRALGPALDGGGPSPKPGRRALLAPAPGEHHVFGLSVVAAFLRRAGWDVTFEPRLPLDGLLELLGGERFDAVGLSASGDRCLDALPSQVAALRRGSRAPGIAVLVGGAAFLADPGLLGRVGADAAPRDAAEAVRVAEALVERAAAA